MSEDMKTIVDDEVRRALGEATADLQRRFADGMIAMRDKYNASAEETRRAQVAAGAFHEGIYFVQREGGGPIKIGFSTNIEKRVRMLQIASPELLHVIAHGPGTLAEENLLQRRLAAFRVRGEWYRDCDEIRAAIRAVCS